MDGKVTVERGILGVRDQDAKRVRITLGEGPGDGVTSVLHPVCDVKKYTSFYKHRCTPVLALIRTGNSELGCGDLYELEDKERRKPHTESESGKE